MTRNAFALIAAGLSLTACNKTPPAAEDTPATAPTAEGLASDGQSTKLPMGHPPLGGPTPHLPAPPVAVEGGAPHAGGLTWLANQPLQSRPPASAMRAAEYAVAGDGPDSEATLTVYFFGAGQGGSVQDNVNRWIGQFTQPDGKSSQDAATIIKVASGSVPVTKVDLRGTYGGGMAPMMGQPAKPLESQRLLGAIADGPQGPVFFKLIGPSATVDRAQGAFDDLVSSIKPR